MTKTTPAAICAALVAATAHAQAPGRSSLTIPPTAAPQPRAEPPATPRPPGPRPPVVRGSVLEEVSGAVREVDRKAHRLTVETASGPVSLSLDRNTMVYTASGLGTILDLAPDQQIRAGRNADFLAYWVQVRGGPAKAAPASTPGQGTGPAGGGAAPSGEGTGTGAGPAATPPSAVPGAVPPGGTPPAR